MILLCNLSITAFAQTDSDQDVPMADLLRSNGKIYVVVGTILIIFVGIIAMLIWLERKIKKMEDKNQ